jgi:hypothetical protein
MKNFFIGICLICMPLGALEREPWLGNWLEFEAALSQKHTQSHRVDTKRRVVHKKLYKEQTSAFIEFMPFEDFSAAAQLDLAKTQRHSYGFDRVAASCRYRLLNDLIGDPVTLALGLASSLSTPSRVKDLSSNQHGVFDTEARIAFGREFIIHEGNYSKVWCQLYSGLASSGDPWLGLEAHIGQVFSHEAQHLDLFFRAERGLASHKLRHLSRFHSYSRIGYEYEEVGLSYRYKEVGLGSLYAEATTRLHAHFCPKDAWSVRLGLLIPFSPW